MIRSIRLGRRGRGQAEIQIAPLIDMMFTLLLFYIATTTFVRETGLRVERPRARAGEALEKNSLLVGIGAAGEVSLEGRRVDLLSLRTMVAQRVARRPDLGVVLVTDRATPAELLVKVMDEAQLGGAKKIAIASRKERVP